MDGGDLALLLDGSDLQQGGLVVLQAGRAGGVLRLGRDAGDLRGAASFGALDPEPTRDCAEAAFTTVAALIRAPAFILGNLPRMKLYLG